MLELLRKAIGIRLRGSSRGFRFRFLCSWLFGHVRLLPMVFCEPPVSGTFWGPVLNHASCGFTAFSRSEILIARSCVFLNTFYSNQSWLQEQRPYPAYSRPRRTDFDTFPNLVLGQVSSTLDTFCMFAKSCAVFKTFCSNQSWSQEQRPYPAYSRPRGTDFDTFPNLVLGRISSTLDTFFMFELHGAFQNSFKALTQNNIKPDGKRQRHEKSNKNKNKIMINPRKQTLVHSQTIPSLGTGGHRVAS